jgi:hypothetical protein
VERAGTDRVRALRSPTTTRVRPVADAAWRGAVMESRGGEGRRTERSEPGRGGCRS